MQLTEAQKIIANDKHRFRVLNCWRRFGKTSLAVLEMVWVAVYNDDSRICYLANTYQQARDIAWLQLKKLTKDIAVTVNESRLEITLTTVKGGSSTIVLRGWESVETLRGQAFDFLIIDEVASMRLFWEGWNEVLSPTLTDRKGSAMFISTPKGFNHFYELYNLEQKHPEDYKSFHFTTYDNPFIPVEEIEREKGTKPEDVFQQEYMADFRKQEGLVYKEFNREKHLIDFKEIPNVNKKMAGIDFGFTNPTAVITCYKDYDNNYWITDEFYKTGKTDAEIANYVKACNFTEVYPDPESPSAIAELVNKGVMVREVVKNKDSIKNGINKIRELFVLGKLKIHKDCTNLIWELETYAYPEKRPGQNEYENPVKSVDHACFTKDALIWLPIGSILKQVSTWIKEVYEFMGSKVTADHPYLTQRGFVRFDRLRYCDRIVVWKNKLLMELHLDDTQTHTAVSLKTILYLLLRNSQAIKQNAYIGIYGKNKMVKYLKVIISTISMAIHLITTYLISNLYQVKNIIKSIMMRCYQSGKKIWKILFKKQVNGQKHQKDKSLEVNVVKKMLNFFQDIKLKEIVMSVVNYISQKQNLENSATIIAKLEPYGKEEVFATLTTNWFFTVNGVVVSNCDALRYMLYMDEPELPHLRTFMRDNVYLNREKYAKGYE